MNPENQFDFWLGEWDARWGEDGKATNTIRRILDGKIVQEDFVAPDLHGMSFSSYDPERNLWCQTWVDSNGTYLDFTGTFEGGKMILSRDAIVRGENVNSEWSGMTSRSSSSTGTGNALKMADKHGAHFGRFITQDEISRAERSEGVLFARMQTKRAYLSKLYIHTRTVVSALRLRLVLE